MGLYKGILLCVALIAFVFGVHWTLGIITYPSQSYTDVTNEVSLLSNINYFVTTQVHYFMFVVLSFLIGGIAAILSVLLDIRDSLEKGD